MMIQNVCFICGAKGMTTNGTQFVGNKQTNKPTNKHNTRMYRILSTLYISADYIQFNIW